VSTVGQAAGPWRSASLTIELVVFDPTHLIDLLNANSIPPRCQRGVSIIGAEQEEIEALLEAALGDWVDFSFVPEPKSFAIYADHDEFTTFFAQNRSNLNRVVQASSGQGVKTGKGISAGDLNTQKTSPRPLRTTAISAVNSFLRS
jgi:hypothetical protein